MVLIFLFQGRTNHLCYRRFMKARLLPVASLMLARRASNFCSLFTWSCRISLRLEMAKENLLYFELKMEGGTGRKFVSKTWKVSE